MAKQEPIGERVWITPRIHRATDERKEVIGMSKSPICQVPNCTEIAKWRCVESGFRYCETHKRPHGTEENHHKFVKIKE
jgi:hypothetical protein